MVWWLVKECFSVMIRPLWLTAPSGRYVLQYCKLYICLIFTNYHRFKHGVVVNENVFFSNDKTITAYYSIC